MSGQKHIERQRQVQAAYRRLLTSPDGETVLRDMMKASGFLRTNYVPGSFDATAHNEGARAFVIRAAKLAHISDDDLLRILLTPENTFDGG